MVGTFHPGMKMTPNDCVISIIGNQKADEMYMYELEIYIYMNSSCDVTRMTSHF